MNINDKISIEKVTVISVTSTEKYGIIVLDGGTKEYPKQIPVKIFKSVIESDDFEKVGAGSIINCELRLSGSEYQGKHYPEIICNSLEVVQAAAPKEIDFLKKIKECSSENQLKSVWQSIPVDKKAAFESAKNAKKTELENLENSDDLPF